MSSEAERSDERPYASGGDFFASGGNPSASGGEGRRPRRRDPGERLRLIASLALEHRDFLEHGRPSGIRAADIGTDHGYAALLMLEHESVGRVILTDINEGPLARARKHLEDSKADPSRWELRLGNGLEPLERGEADSVVIAGMGGDLMCDILAKDISLSRSFKRYVFQPRRAADTLRHFLVDNNIYIVDERVCLENGHLCQIIAAECKRPEVFESFESDIDYEIPPMLLEKAEPEMARFFLEDWRRRLEERRDNILKSSDPARDRARLGETLRRIERVEELLARCGAGEQEKGPRYG
ncbi:MAG: SAM-dependent methyltransferase [Firmicutes bacterium]|nr:SAM-dependent methyltransferase [Bacillota bacterium]